MTDKKPKVIVIVGPTASGKSALAVEIAKEFSGEVISADSRQVYRGLDLTSAKITEAEQAGIPHHLLDVADVTEVYTASNYKHDAEIALKDILTRHQLPIIAGGTFFYVDTLLGKVSTPTVSPNEKLRHELEARTNSELYKELTQKDPRRAADIDPENKRRLVRALEIVDALGEVPATTSESPYDTLTIGLSVDLDQLSATIRERIIERLDQGMKEEVEALLVKGVTHERLEELGLECRYLSRHLSGQMTYEEMIGELTTKTRQFAKRQLTWLKRDQSITWFNKDDQNIFTTVEKFLNN